MAGWLRPPIDGKEGLVPGTAETKSGADPAAAAAAAAAANIPPAAELLKGSCFIGEGLGLEDEIVAAAADWGAAVEVVFPFGEVEGAGFERVVGFRAV